MKGERGREREGEREELRESETLNQLRKLKHVWNAQPLILAHTHIPAKSMYVSTVGVQELPAVQGHIWTYIHVLIRPLPSSCCVHVHNKQCI